PGRQQLNEIVAGGDLLSRHARARPRPGRRSRDRGRFWVSEQEMARDAGVALGRLRVPVAQAFGELPDPLPKPSRDHLDLVRVTRVQAGRILGHARLETRWSARDQFLPTGN